jgi:hypothetical protein
VVNCILMGGVCFEKWKLGRCLGLWWIVDGDEDEDVDDEFD